MFVVIKMENKNKQQLLITVIFALIVSATLYFMYDNFAFQTYGEVVYFDYILSGENKVVKLDNYEVYRDKDELFLGNGKLTFKNAGQLKDSDNVNVQLSIHDDENTVSHDYGFSFKPSNLTYELGGTGYLNKDALANVKRAALTIEVNDQEITTLSLKINPCIQMIGSNKEFRMEGINVSDKMIRLGSLKTSNIKIIKEYPNVSIEYRYLKDKKKSKEDNDNYIVFSKLSGKSSELVNGSGQSTYYLETGSFKDKDLSVVVIFSNDKDKYAFSIDLTKREVGDYYG